MALRRTSSPDIEESVMWKPPVNPERIASIACSAAGRPGALASRRRCSGDGVRTGKVNRCVDVRAGRRYNGIQLMGSLSGQKKGGNDKNRNGDGSRSRVKLEGEGNECKPIDAMAEETGVRVPDT